MTEQENTKNQLSNRLAHLMAEFHRTTADNQIVEAEFVADKLISGGWQPPFQATDEEIEGLLYLMERMCNTEGSGGYSPSEIKYLVNQFRPRVLQDYKRRILNNEISHPQISDGFTLKR